MKEQMKFLKNEQIQPDFVEVGVMGMIPNTNEVLSKVDKEISEMTERVEQFEEELENLKIDPSTNEKYLKMKAELSKLKKEERDLISKN